MLKRFQRWWVRHFGSFEQQQLTVFQELIDQHVGVIATRGFYLRDTADETTLQDYLQETIACARAPYGETALIIKALPLAEDLHSKMPGEQLTRISAPFRKETWKEVKGDALAALKELAARSPAQAVGIKIFNFGEVMLAAMEQEGWEYQKNENETRAET